MAELIKGDCKRGLNKHQIRSLLIKNYLSEIDQIEVYDLTFNSNYTRADLIINFKGVE
tara:strand:- start:1007 stop:1180 length:174 start_codon:yes stop_codon:yes gene_type:complete